jgi:hypothetical protein
MLKQKIAYGCYIFNPLQNVWFKKKCSKFFILVTNHQILVFGVRGLGGHICKNIE